MVEYQHHKHKVEGSNLTHVIKCKWYVLRMNNTEVLRAATKMAYKNQLYYTTKNEMPLTSKKKKRGAF